MIGGDVTCHERRSDQRMQRQRPGDEQRPPRLRRRTTHLLDQPPTGGPAALIDRGAYHLGGLDVPGDHCVDPVAGFDEFFEVTISPAEPRSWGSWAPAASTADSSCDIDPPDRLERMFGSYQGTTTLTSRNPFIHNE
jgi:hypothetical protein